MVSYSAALADAVHPVPLKRKIAAILAADVAGYSRLVAEDEERTLRDLAAAREIFDALVAQAGGRIFNTAGDSVMCEFDSAVGAVRAAVDIQDNLRARNLGTAPGRRLEFRMGLTIGDVVERGGDLLGDGVNIAARLEAMAPAGGICVSRSVHEAVANKLSVTFRELGPRQLKNIPQPVHAYLVAPALTGLSVSEPLTAGHPVKPSRSASAKLLRRLSVVAFVLVLVFAGIPALKVLRSTIESLAPAAPTRVTAIPDPTQNEDRPAQPTSPTVTRPPPRQQVPPKQTAGRDAQKPDASPPGPERNPAVDPATAYATLAREGVIADASTFPELYHNARAYEAKGDRGAALTAYAAVAPVAGDRIDPHLRYASLIRATKGAAAARQAYAALARTSPSNAVTLVAALSAEGDERRAKIEAFASANPSVAAADYLLADALTDARDGGPTLTERRLAFDALDRFLEASASGQLVSHFIDQTFLDGWLDGARRRRGEIETFFASAAVRPGVTFARTSAGWLARLSLPEPATAVAVRIGERGETIPVTAIRSGEARPGKAAPTMEFELPSSTGRSTLYVSYTDRAGRTAGPFPLAFDPGVATASSGRTVLERFPDSWVSFRPDIPDVLSFASLVSNRCALTRAAIGYGDEPPSVALPLPACDTTGPASMPSGSAIVKLPDGTESVQVQLTYADGSESQVRTFRRP